MLRRTTTVASVVVALLALFQGYSRAGDGPGLPDNTAFAKSEVEVYDQPVAPRKVIGTFPGTAGSSVLAYHPHGWCQLDLGAWGLGKGWIAQNHLSNCPPPTAVPGAPMGKVVGARNDVDIFDSPKKPRKVIGMMRQDETAKVTGVDFAWWQLDLPATEDFSGGKGWVASNHLKLQ